MQRALAGESVRQAGSEEEIDDAAWACERIALELRTSRGVDLALLPDETLLGELAAYGMERLSGGGFRYSAPPGLHDDTVIALALAWHAARHGGAMGIEFL